MKLCELIGKACVYRPLHSREMKDAVIVGGRVVENFGGEAITLLDLDNGDEVSVAECYFPRPWTA